MYKYAIICLFVKRGDWATITRENSVNSALKQATEAIIALLSGYKPIYKKLWQLEASSVHAFVVIIQSP